MQRRKKQSVIYYESFKQTTNIESIYSTGAGSDNCSLSVMNVQILPQRTQKPKSAGKKRCLVTYGGVINLLGLFTNLKVFCCVSYGVYRNFFIFLFEDTHKYSILTKIQKFLSKNNFFIKKVLISISPKSGEKFKIKKLTTFLKSSYQKT